MWENEEETEKVKKNNGLFYSGGGKNCIASPFIFYNEFCKCKGSPCEMKCKTGGRREKPFPLS